MYDMDASELEGFIRGQEEKVAALRHNRPGSQMLDFESGLLKDARQLLATKGESEHPDDITF